ncbi:MAG TPA: type II secretion system F family protein [Dehalococcoidales bacterium]|nr:type II secretion system F family protein [Dehalococcoidales bacterium]
MLYKYYAYKLDKQVIAGTIDAGSEQSAEEALYQSGYKYVLDLQALPPRPKLHQLIPSLFGVKNSDIIEFARQLAAFLESGSSLRTSLDLLREQNPKAAVKALLSDIISKLEQGSSFSHAIRAHPQIFPHSFLEVIESCEKTGELEKGLLQIAGYLEHRAAVMEKIRRAVAYPLFVVCLAIGVCVLMVTSVMPSIVRLLDSFQASLPPVTQLVLAVFNFITYFKYHILAGIAGSVILLFTIYKLPGGRVLFDRAALSTPVLGNIIITHNLGLFCRTAAMLLKSGLPLPNIMEVAVRSASGNRIVNQSLQKLKERLMQGEGLAVPVSQDKLFPSMMVKMIAVGEQTGTLEESLENLANYYQEYTRKRISTLVALIEPALTILIGIAIAILMISMIIPIYKIMGSA